MTTYAVTAVTGHLGPLVVERLLAEGVPAERIVAVARTPQKAAALAARGVVVREGDYDRPDTLATALAGVDAVLLISGSEVGKRVRQHTAVLDAARASGVRRVVYTSAPKADDTDLPLAPEHRATEEAVRASGLAYTIVRHNWYLENYTERLAQYLSTGVILGAAGDGRIAGATREDFAAADVAVLTGQGHDGRTYELSGTPFTMAELAATITEVTGTKVGYTDLDEPAYAEALRSAGLDEQTAGFVAALDASIGRSALDLGSETLERLLGRPTTPLIDAVRRAAK